MSQSLSSAQIQEELDYRAAIADCFLDLSKSCIPNNAYDDALKYIDLAVNLFLSQNRDLSSLRIETDLRAIADFLPAVNKQSDLEQDDPSRKPVCLHVLQEALAFGGHTAMATRWIELDKEARIHSVVLLSQKLPPPPELVKAVSDSGGEIYITDQKLSILEQSAWLRALAGKTAAYVILHTDTANLIATVAFGKQSGPPVMMINHAAHLYWGGGSAPDVIVNCRGSRLEEHWTRIHRGAANCMTIPIPLPKPGNLSLKDVDRNERKARAREIIGIPDESILIMTSGASYKFKPFGKMDFLSTCQDILESVPEAFILAAGVIEDDRWRDVSNTLDFRLRGLGGIPQSDIALLHEASDIYIEGFPFGSTTALLEAGLQRLPVVLSPAECPPPYGSDGVALDDILERPASIEQYKLEVIRLCRNLRERTSTGVRLQKSILEHHTGAGWMRYLTNALESLPPEHSVYPIQAPLRTPPAIYEYWHNFMETQTPNRCFLEDQLVRAFSFGLRPKITPKMERACRSARRLRNSGVIPLWLLIVLCNYIFSLLPLSLSLIIFRTVKFYFREGLLVRLRNRAVSLFRRNDDSQTSHGQYRYLQKRFRWVGSANQPALKENLKQE